MKSLPHFVFLTFGSMDSHHKSFTEEKFVNAYKNLIKDVQNLPTRPMVFLMVPVSTCNHTLKLEAEPEKARNNWIASGKNCSKEARRDM